VRDGIARGVMRDLSMETIESSLEALREIKDRIKALSASPDHLAAK
jgi:two-component sensor histidine kinase